MDRKSQSKISFANQAIRFDLEGKQGLEKGFGPVSAGNHRIDGLIANAGIMALPKLENRFGYELQLFTNHIGHFILINGILNQVKDESRITILSSSAHKMIYKEGTQFESLSGEKEHHPWKAYGQSKSANLLFARHLARRVEHKKIVVNAVHPGVIKTNLGRHLPKTQAVIFSILGDIIGMKSVTQGAAIQLFATVRPKAEGITGQYLCDSNVQKSSPHGEDSSIAEKLWEISERIAADTAR